MDEDFIDFLPSHLRRHWTGVGIDFAEPVMLLVNEVKVCKHKDVRKLTISDDGILRVHHRFARGIKVSCFKGFWAWTQDTPKFVQYIPSPTEDDMP